MINLLKLLICPKILIFAQTFNFMAKVKHAFEQPSLDMGLWLHLLVRYFGWQLTNNLDYFLNWRVHVLRASMAEELLHRCVRASDHLFINLLIIILLDGICYYAIFLKYIVIFCTVAIHQNISVQRIIRLMEPYRFIN